MIPKFQKGDRVEAAKDCHSGGGYRKGDQGTIDHYAGMNGFGRSLYGATFDRVSSHGSYPITQDNLIAATAANPGISAPKFQSGDRVIYVGGRWKSLIGLKGTIVSCNYDTDFSRYNCLVNFDSKPEGPRGTWEYNLQADGANNIKISFGGISPKKENNDGRDTCRWCGEKTEAVGLFGGSKMRICKKCELKK